MLVEKTPRFGPFISQTLENRVEGCAWLTSTHAPPNRAGFARSLHEATKPAFPWDVATRASIGSVSKPVTAVAVLRLMDEGRLDVRRTFFSYLESRLAIEPGTGVRGVTVANLLNMKSCLQPYDDLDPAPGEDIWSFLARYLKKPIQEGCSPGEKYDYSNVNYTVLQAVVIAVSTEGDYTQYVHRHVFAKMRISPSELTSRPDERNQATLCYRDLADSSAGLYWPEVQFIAPGGWIGSAHALLSFLKGVRARTVLKPDTTELMFDQGYGWRAVEGLFGRYYCFVGLRRNAAGQAVMAIVVLFGKQTDADMAVLLTNSMVEDDLLLTMMVNAYEAPVPLSWSEPVETGAHSNSGPALTVFHDRLWMVYRRTSGTLGVRSSGDGKTWIEMGEIQGNPQPRTSKTPALAVFQGKLWVAYRGETRTDLYVTCSGDGAAWKDQERISDQNGARSREGPALVEFERTLWLAFVAEGGNQVSICASADGAKWSFEPTSVTPGGTGAPSLAVDARNRRLYLGSLQASTLSVVASEDGRRWGTPLKVSDNVTPNGHALAVYRNSLCAVFRHSKSQLSISVLQKGQWSRFGISQLDGAKANAMALAPAGNRLFLATQREGSLAACSFGGYLWEHPEPVQKGLPLPARSAKGPALATFGSRMYLAFRGDLDGTIATAALVWATGWLESTPLDWKTNQAPALAVFRGLLYLVFVDEASALRLASTSDGARWGNSTLIPGAKSSEGVALASFEDQLWLAYRGDKAKLTVRAWDGKSWSDKSPREETRSRPALAVFNDRLWLAFRGNADLWVTGYDGTKWTPTNVTDKNGAKTGEGPALAAFGGELFLAYRGEDEAKIRLCTSPDGKAWSSQAYLDPEKALSAQSPALAAYWGDLFLAWRSDASGDKQGFCKSRLGLTRFDVLPPVA